MSLPLATHYANALSQVIWKSGVVFLALLFVSVSFMACSDDPASTAPELDPDPEPEEVEVTVEGVVTGEDEEPLVGAEVSVFRGDQEEALGEGTTADDGAYDMTFSVQEDNTPEQLRLKVEAEGFTVYEESFDFGVDVNRDITLQAATVEASFSGSITDVDAGDPIEGTTVTGIETETGTELFEVTSDAEGNYQADIQLSEEPDEVTVSASAEGFEPSDETVAFAEEIAVDFALEASTVEATVSGTVTDAGSGSGIAGSTVTGVRADDGTTLFDATTEADGSYAATFEVATAPNEVTITATADGFEPSDETVAFAEEIAVDFALEASTVEVTVSGTVTDAETGDTIEGATLSGVRPDTGAGLFNIETGTDGTYEALFEVKAGDEPTEITVEATADGFDSSETTVAFSEELTVDFALAVSTVEATVSGTVSDAGSGSGIAGSTVTGVRADDGTTLFDATTEADGSYAATFEVATAPNEVTITATADEFDSSEETVAFAEELVVGFALEARFEQIGEPAVATDGMTVTLESLTFVDNDTFYEYSIQYTLKNETDSLIDETNFKMYFLNQSGGTPQFGAFGTLAPGESKTRSYTWQEDEGKFGVLEYHDDNFFSDEPLEDSLKWKVPTE